MIKPRIKLSHHVIIDENGNLCFGEIPGLAYVVKNPPEQFASLVGLLDGTRTVPRIQKDMFTRHPAMCPDEIQALIDQMIALNLIEDATAETKVLTSSEKELYNRQMLYFSLLDKKGAPGFRYQEALKRQRVTVLGLGGWGTWMSLNLSLAGFGHLRIVDGDVVELSNLNRQVLYGHDDLGRPKAEAAAGRLRSVNPFIDVEFVSEFVERNDEQIRGLLKGSTLIVLAWANMAYFRKDTVEERIHKIAAEMGIPLIEMGGDPLSISVGPIFANDGKSPCLECVRGQMRGEWYSNDETVSALRKARLKESFSNGTRRIDAWQNAPSLSAMSGLAADQAIKLATGCAPTRLLGSRFMLSLETFESRVTEYKRTENCASCSAQLAVPGTAVGCGA